MSLIYVLLHFVHFFCSPFIIIRKYRFLLEHMNFVFHVLECALSYVVMEDGSTPWQRKK